jgi:beta-xylosidase
MIEAVMLWNEPNNKSYWDLEIDPDWARFASMTRLAGDAIASEAPGLPRVPGGISPIDPLFIANLAGKGVLDRLDVIAVHGFPLDWNLWMIDEWPAKLEEIAAASGLPVGCPKSALRVLEVQEFGLQRTAELLIGRARRIHWYSLYDLPKAWPATTRHREAEGSSYYRHFYMGLLREDGTPKHVAGRFADYTPELGICQWFHFDDHRLEDAVCWLWRLGVRYLRTGISWADSFRPDAEAWFGRQMRALEDFAVTVTFCFTPEHRGLQPHHTSPPLVEEEFAEFCCQTLRRYWRAGG